jgi:hypothetical protein
MLDDFVLHASLTGSLRKSLGEAVFGMSCHFPFPFLLVSDSPNVCVLRWLHVGL